MKVIHDLYLLLSLVFVLFISPSHGQNEEDRNLRRTNISPKDKDRNLRNSSKSRFSRDPRIVNGYRVRSPDTHPYFVRVRRKNDSNPIHCGGSLIGPDVVLCAAHCDSDDLIVDVNAYSKNNFFDKSSAITRSVRKRIKHPRYDPATFAFDFLILILDAPVTVAPIKLNDNLAIPVTRDSPQGRRDDVTAIGLGSTTIDTFTPANYLQAVSLKTVSYEFCNSPSSYDGAIEKPVMFCAGYQEGNGSARDSCYGDSGGPLVDKDANVQLGVISWGVGCAMESFPGVYANVAVVYEWIDDQACRESRSKSGGYLSCHQAQLARHRSRRRPNFRSQGDSGDTRRQYNSGDLNPRARTSRPTYRHSGT
mmetsp:Transcript_22798/g.31908  ORF Transcript_22798/g.31908 Transcript_22798/m.31908 type:complete len:364 (+) Transcript_22798:206-1297(+)